MPKILPLHPKLKHKLTKHQLTRKYQKQIKLLAKNPNHPSLNLELLEPKHMGIYRFRIDRKYRALLIFRPEQYIIEIINITVHYQ